MPVVINEFEVVTEAPLPSRRGGSEPAAETPSPAAPDACSLARALRVLDERAMRVWAH
jgi:hypothetical protein